MSNTPPIYDDEIDFLSFIQTIWSGKWKIVSIIVVSLFSVFGLNFIKPNTNFTASTEIKPITSFDFDRYRLFNSSLKIIETEKNKEKQEEEEKEEKDQKIFKIFEITQNSLLSSYVEQIQEGSLLENGIDKYNLINKDDFDDERDYKEAIEKFASKIEVIKPTKQKNETLSHYVLKVIYDDKDKWKKLIAFVNNEANRKVKASIINSFATIVSIYNQKKKFAIQDLEIKIDNAKKDYERNTKDRLAFLTEQAAIARKLDIEKNTIASQRFSAQNTFVTNVKTDAPFYLRGYLAIEEEINQIKNRKNKRSFVKTLYELEQKQRDIRQDRTLTRAIELFNKTPLNDNDFNATIVKVATTDFEVNTKHHLYYAVAIVLGGTIGVVYVLIANAIRNRENKTVIS